MRKTPQEVAAILRYLYDLTFGSKPSGRFQIPAERLRKLCGRSSLRDAFIEELEESCEEEGLKLFSIGDNYIVLNIDTLHRYRKPNDEMIDGFKPLPLKELGEIKPGTRIRKNFGEDDEEDWYEGTIRQVFKNKLLYVTYDDDSMEITSADEVELIKNG
jgi:hypothetical protein